MEERYRPDIDPARLKLEHRAEEFIKLLQYALHFNALLTDPDNFSSELKLKAEQTAQAAIHDSYLDILPFNFRIELPEDNPGKLSRNWEIISESEFEFEASEVRRLDPEQVDFHNIKTDEWLTLKKHQIDRITALFPE